MIAPRLPSLQSIGIFTEFLQAVCRRIPDIGGTADRELDAGLRRDAAARALQLHAATDQLDDVGAGD